MHALNEILQKIMKTINAIRTLMNNNVDYYAEYGHK